MRPLAILIAVTATVCIAAAQSRGGGVGHGYSGGSGRSAVVSPPPGSIVNPGVAGRGYSGYGGYGYRGYGSRGYGYGYRGYGYGGGLVLAYPLYFGAYDSGYYGAPGYPPPQGYYDDSMGGPPPAPAVVINQNFIPPVANPMVRDYGDQSDDQSSGMRTYQNIPPKGEPEATIYLIAFKDHTVVPALGWWVEGRTIKYVNLDHDINQASVDLIDRDLSKKLNAQRNIDFTLPPTAPQG
jgi:hypothetical protein